MFVYILILLQLICVVTATYKKPVAEKVWSQRCTRNSHVLNDCNWCWCNQNEHYECRARVCEEVDVFGHFKDTIMDVDVGMEGHGIWRSTPTLCDPGVEYRRGNVYCICDEDGNWPNPVCRDLFRLLHPVEVTENAENSTSQSCSPTKLYLVGCNVCFCPSTGKLDPNLCTNTSCFESDPVLAPKESTSTRLGVRHVANEEVEIYAKCTSRKNYKMRCGYCKCLSNNRLVCDSCSSKTPGEGKLEKKIERKNKTVCSGHVGSSIKIDCNTCQCESNEHMYCTTKKCVRKNKGLNLAVKRDKPRGKLVEAPIDEQECVIGTFYKRHCNTCYCQRRNRNKELVCTVKPCAVTALELLVADCVEDTIYLKDNVTCACEKINDQKYETCVIIHSGIGRAWKKENKRTEDLPHGYCEPMHVYKQACNTCQCLSNGKIVKCTTKLCATRSSESISVDIVPLYQSESEPCPKGRLYRIGCNICFCLSNGNVLCTTADCATFRNK